jgi:hypothetical protein
MGMFRNRAPRDRTVMLGDVALRCLVCGGGEFAGGSAKLNTSGMEFLDLGWANRSASTFTCDRCGFIHYFEQR